MRIPAFYLRFLLLLTLLLGAALGIHAWMRGQAGLETWSDRIPACYGINYFLAATIVAFLYSFRRKARNLIGFLFIGGGLLKFLLFFLLLYPAFKADGEMSRAEFASFFVPYFLALILETFFVARMLREMESEDAR